MSLQSTWSCFRPAAARRVPPTVPRTAAAALSTTSASRSQQIPPESPSYIRLPQVPQSTETKPERVRGTLPVPRAIFDRADGDRKARPEYVERTAPRRRDDENNRRPLNSDTQKWKKQLADSRRENLAQAAGRRHDARTVLESIYDTAVRPDPERFAKAERSRARVQALEGARRDARRDALMELYINATTFIVTEAELQAEIDTIFHEDYFRKLSIKGLRAGATENVWGVHGAPPGLASMFETVSRTSTNVANASESEFDHSVKRTKKISEELTGGKMA
ncbi:uncharacterized protein BBA_01617 [Beauveria bassiana ARSEF 2860]|uniref:Uncharacterized protein n=1 Tax=Beauveria bassiana (strain ARSEF 2860) TaxID=655819 RepID=J4UUH9_BEAB2|nr:uncharacterized protein BBA_01617 [Beauveria bassiana ARSEF 2860]EJP69652.1 hypothetical protein BBA_01617 [Beauveria bassiana ARSEF 2860]